MEFFLRSWIINIVAIGFLGVLIDLMLSESEFRKNTRFVIGLIMLIAIIRPVLHLLSNPPEFEGLLFESAKEANIEVFGKKNIERANEIEERIMDIFTENFQNQIEDQVNAIIGQRSVEAKVRFKEDDEGQDELNSIEGIWLKISNKEQNDSEVARVNIPDIEISYDNFTGDDIAYADKAAAIRKHLSEMYSISEEVIHISFEGAEYAKP